ncbi:cytochrome b [Duganella callida]|uniref:Cytochrome b n=1 Tax=Duganella callida TaxID=2561932 RepID=A0A4Y9SRZ0_9BURK|nr:cytochrome b/b6 domain-containing protein [Duganella callida]TFW29470.1 cytochrome b [Duganella callida]
MTPSRFPLALRLLHWIMAPLLLAMLLIGTGMVATVSHWRITLINLHKPLGLALLVLAVLRLLLRLRGRTPPLPASVPAPMRLAAHGSHWLLYGCMLAMPLIGWAMLSAGGFPLPSFAGIALPPLLAPDVSHYALLRALHMRLGELFYLLVCVHIMAGLMHALLLRDGVFDAITLRRRKN